MASISDSSFHWTQSAFVNVMLNTGTKLLPFAFQVSQMISLTIEKCVSWRGFKWAGKALRSVLTSLTMIYPMDCRSMDSKKWNDKSYLRVCYKRLGQPVDAGNIDIAWHIPSEAEIQWAVELLKQYVSLALERLRNVQQQALQGQMDQRVVMNELARWLTLLKNCILGMTCLIDLSASINKTHKQPLENRLGAPKRPLNAGYCLSDPSDPRYQFVLEIHYAIANYLVEAFDYFSQYREDDAESFKYLVRVVRIFLTNRGVDRIKYEGMLRG